VWKSKFYGAFVLNRRVVLHAIDATPARWRGDAGSSPLDRARTAASSPRNDLVKNCRAPVALVDFHTDSNAPQASQPLYFEAAQASQKMGPVVGHAGFSARLLSGEPVHARGSRALLSSGAAQEGQVARLHQRVAARSQLTHFRKPPSTPRSGAASKDTALTPRDRGRRSGDACVGLTAAA
jgi:hypothetical protein